MGETVQIQSLVCFGKGGGVLVQLHSLCMFDYIRERESGKGLLVLYNYTVVW